MSLKKVVKTLLSEMDTSDITENFFHGGFELKKSRWDSEEGIAFKEGLKQRGLTKVESVDSYGGEGQGDTYYNVYEFSDGKECVFVKFNGWYQSYNGSEYQEWFFVEPVEVTSTEYVRVK